MDENKIGELALGAAMKVHTAMGPGLLESVYEACLARELSKQALLVKRQVPVPVSYDGEKLDAGFRLDLLVNDKVVLEIKAVEKLLSIHLAQIMTYLRLSGLKLGYLLNFSVPHMRDGIKRVVNGL